ncbi:MAG: hypothetical protein SPF89_11320 [Sphaerochaetaceae bacterium]|nr:hypothetical protein [Spirochaetales bacterium]MDY5500686.1 hypothetical protein [Sphaerochaetaceae bacterium]
MKGIADTRLRLVTLMATVMVLAPAVSFATVSNVFYFNVDVADTFSIEELETHPATISYSSDSETNKVVAVISGVSDSSAADFAALKTIPGTATKKTFTVTPENGVLVGEHDASHTIPYVLSYKKDGSSIYNTISSGGTSFHWTPTASQVGKSNQICVFAVSIEPTELEGAAGDSYSDVISVEMAVE